eukprot:Sspe_Gene.112643::Locus_95780_Transcript_1_1_Confidence_1.000_Length_590::g.112643::m.112643
MFHFESLGAARLVRNALAGGGRIPMKQEERPPPPPFKLRGYGRQVLASARAREDLQKVLSRVIDTPEVVEDCVQLGGPLRCSRSDGNPTARYNAEMRSLLDKDGHAVLDAWGRLCRSSAAPDRTSYRFALKACIGLAKSPCDAYVSKAEQVWQRAMSQKMCDDGLWTL